MSAGVTEAAPEVQDGAEARRRDRILGIAGVVLVLLLVLEVSTRVIESRLPDPLVWHSYETQRKVEQMDDLAATGVDVVFFGSSMVNAAVIPALFESTAGGGITAYNAALSSGTPRLTAAWGLNVVLPRLRPKLVVIGTSSVDMTDNGRARTLFYDGFRNSPAGLEVLGTEDILDRTDRFLREHLALWAHRAELRDPAALWDAVRGNEPTVDGPTESMDARGHLTNLEAQPFDQRPFRDGIAGVSVWGLGTEDPGALRRLIAGAEATGARVVLVDLPITAEYIAFHPRGDADYQASKRAIAEMANDTGAGLIDLDQPRDHALFADELHLNGDGARRFTATLANALRAQDALPRR